MSSGLFITFEGIDGSGKSTQIDVVKRYMKENNRDVVFVREPGGTSIGEKVRQVLLSVDNSEMEPLTEAYLYAASRAQLVREVIIPSLKDGKTVICDRFLDSSIAYQAYGRELGDSVAGINSWAVGNLVPDLTFWIDVPVKVGQERVSSGEIDRLEKESVSFHEKVYNGYCRLAEQYPDRIMRIDGTAEISEITEVIIDHLRSACSWK